MTFSIDNYSLGLCDDHYIIGHFNNLSPEDQRTVLTFLDNMESLKKALPSDDSASDELIAYADDVVNALTHRMASTEKNNAYGRLEKIKELNRMFEKTNNYLKIFSKRVKQTTIEAIKTERDKDTFVEADYKGYLDILKEQYVRTEKEAIKRITKAKTGLNVHLHDIETLGLYDNPNRDPRGWTIANAHIVFKNTTTTHKDANLKWALIERDYSLSVDGQPITLAFDHKQILLDALEQFKRWSYERPVQLKLLGETFTIPYALQLLGRSRTISRTQFMRSFEHMLIKTDETVQNNKKPSTLWRLRPDL